MSVSKAARWPGFNSLQGYEYFSTPYVKADPRNTQAHGRRGEKMAGAWKLQLNSDQFCC
jgi:hypothetical protein